MDERQRFARCLPALLKHEGGFVNDSRDPGGITNLGVTKATYSNWLGREATVQEMRRLSAQDVGPIYDAWYWRAAACDRLPAGLDYLVFDAAVNQGASRARRWLQRALGVPDDGQIGPVTMLALKGCDPSDIIKKVRASREAAYRALSTFPAFGKGWLRRLAEVEAQALAWAGAASTAD